MWRPDEIKLLQHLRPWCTRSEISNIFGLLGLDINPSQIKDRINRYKETKFIELRIPDMQDFPRKIQRAVTKVIKDRALIQLPSQTSNTIAASNKILTSLLEEVKSLEVSSKRPSTKLPKVGSSLCVLLSDLHIGRVIQDAQGHVLYNHQVAEDRVLKLAAFIKDFIRKQHQEIVIILLGDILDGEGIYPGQMGDLEANLSLQVKLATTTLWKMLQELKTCKIPIRVVTCRGNHGRSALRESNANWDDVVYQYLNMLIEQQKEDVSVSLTRRDYNLTQVQGWTILARHKAPVQADTLGARSYFAGWESIHAYDSMVYAHSHHWGVFTWNSKAIFRNGSIIGPDNYSEQLAVSDHPTQLIFEVSRETLPISILPIKL